MKFEIHANRYSRIYFKIVGAARAKGRKRGSEYESHHIVPRCFGGGDGTDNLVLLTYREHFLCHWLLTKCTSGQGLEKMRYALHAMRMKGRASSWQYEVARRAHRANTAGKKPAAFKRGAWTEAQKEAARRNIGDTEALKRGRLIAAGLPKSEEHKKALSKSVAALPRILCERCGKTAPVGMFNRWHGQNCQTRTHCARGHAYRPGKTRCYVCDKINRDLRRHGGPNAERSTIRN